MKMQTGKYNLKGHYSQYSIPCGEHLTLVRSVLLALTANRSKPYVARSTNSCKTTSATFSFPWPPWLVAKIYTCVCA